MSRMASHEPFGYVEHKLWSKEGPGVKLAIWLPTTKSQESTWPWCVQIECDTPLESSWGELQVCLRLCPNQRLESGVMSSQSPGSPNQDIWMRVSRSNAKNTMWGKVVACPESGPWWVQWVKVARGLSQHQKWSKWVLTNLLVGFGCRTE
jgi:hypothetical protein